MTDPHPAHPPPRRSRRPPARRVRVIGTEPLTPHMQRVTLGGDGLDGFHTGSPASYVKLYLPAPGQADLVLPTFGPKGPEYPDGATRPVQRTYTPRNFDPRRNELDIDVVLHGAGVASDWAAGARPGDPAGVAGPGSGWDPDADAPWFVLVGDESALPAIATITEALPEGRTLNVIVEIPTDSDRIDLTSPAVLITSWLVRGEGQPGAALEDAVRGLHLPVGDGHFWVATESAVVRRIRDHLVADRGLDRSRYTIRAYWKAGEAGT
ncbi:siderophore-interacting protein [soil metagenome]